MSPLPAAPGDVLAVWTSNSWPAWLIRIGSLLRGKPSPANHVIGVTHQDPKGRWIGLQGQPGGVGLVDCTPFLADPRTRSNHFQPKPQDFGKPGSLAADDRLVFLLASAAKTIGVQYDWMGIAEDVALALHAVSLATEINKLYAWPADHGQLPGDVVCSSLWAVLYDLPQVAWAHPNLNSERVCQPCDWWHWNDTQRWAAGGRRGIADPP